jgi:tRNA (adenine37-N6)-methyltransferase
MDLWRHVRQQTSLAWGSKSLFQWRHSVRCAAQYESSHNFREEIAMKVEVHAIGFVEASRLHAEDDFWGGERACITLIEKFSSEALQGIAEFSHVEVLHLFHEAQPSKIVTGARYPRNNHEWPSVGIFAQRGKNRPNRIGSAICKIDRVEGSKLFVSELDAINGTPVLDIKPVMVEFLPRQQVRQPTWAHELMRNYWAPKA